MRIGREATGGEDDEDLTVAPLGRGGVVGALVGECAAREAGQEHADEHLPELDPFKGLPSMGLHEGGPGLTEGAVDDEVDGGVEADEDVAEEDEGADGDAVQPLPGQGASNQAPSPHPPLLHAPTLEDAGDEGGGVEDEEEEDDEQGRHVALALLLRV